MENMTDSKPLDTEREMENGLSKKQTRVDSNGDSWNCRDTHVAAIYKWKRSMECVVDLAWKLADMLEGTDTFRACDAEHVWTVKSQDIPVPLVFTQYNVLVSTLEALADAEYQDVEVRHAIAISERDAYGKVSVQADRSEDPYHIQKAFCI